MLPRGEYVLTPPLTLELLTHLPSTSWVSSIPHNALEDARALRRLAKIEQLSSSDPTFVTPAL